MASTEVGGRGKGDPIHSDAIEEEIVVTAQKREERLIDIPQSVSVLTADALERTGATQFRDFASTVPGLSFTTNGAGNTSVTLRGVTTGADTNPTVGIYVDDVPYGSSSRFSSGAQFALDVGLFDINRIEVLRGPQGTLYGASTMGGLLKYVTEAPDLNSFGVNVLAGTSTTQQGGMNYNGAVAVNAPLSTDVAALRVNGFYSRDDGFVKNTSLGGKDVGAADIYGGRADLLLHPSEALSVRFTGFAQNISRNGESTVDYSFAGVPVAGELDQRRAIDEPFDQHFRLGSATVKYDFDAASLISISSYQSMDTSYIFDASPIYVPLTKLLYQRTYSAVGTLTGSTTNRFTQEVRLVSSKTKTLDWLVGLYYTHENSELTQSFVLRDALGQPAPNDLLTYAGPSTFEEYAGFADLTWHLTDKFDITGGIRTAWNQQKFEQIGSGRLIGSMPPAHSNDDVSTYLANARYHVSDHTTGYVRFATGYRPGGPNLVAIDPATQQPVGPPTFGSDSLKSYELGLKTETEDRRFGVDLATYYIKWDNFQLSVRRGAFSGYVNAPGGADIHGAELSTTARPFRALTLTGAFAWQDAKMADAAPDLGAAKGERLPNVPKFTAAIAADYELPFSSLQPTIGTSLTHVGERPTSFDLSTRRQYHLPEYTSVDLRGGVTFDRMNLQLYVRNLFDRRAQLSAPNTIYGSAHVAVEQPRTVGLTLTTHF